MSNRTYDVFKYIFLTVIPAFVLMVSTILGLLHIDGDIIAIVTGCISAVATFGGTVLGFSSKKYQGEKVNEEANG